MGTAVTNQYCFLRKCYGRLNSGNICFRSVKNHLSWRLLYKKAKIVILVHGHKTTFLLVVMCVCVSPPEKNAGGGRTEHGFLNVEFVP
jgi:hypothetical protein